MLAVPMPTVIGPPYLRFEDVRITAVSVVGGILIFAGWVFYSRLHHYLVVPFALLLRLGLKWLSIAAFFLILILETLVTLLLGQWFLSREMQKEKIEWIKKFKHSHPDQDGEMAYAQHVKNLQNKHGDKILVQRALEKVVIKKGILGDMAATVLSALLKKLQSPGRIGIAPLVSYTYAEDFHAEKIQLQVFAVAIAKLNAVLQNQEGIEHIQFCVLPAHCKIMNNRQAAFFSRLFGLDVLLWGSYLDAGGEIVWLNIYRAYAAKDKEKDSDDTGLDFQFGIFPLKVQVEMPVVTFPQKDCRDAYIVMVVALVQALQAREVKCSDRKRKFNFLV